VKRGQVLGSWGIREYLGAALTLSPDGKPVVLGSNGIPYVIDSFAITGQVSEADFAAARGVEGDGVRDVLLSQVRDAISIRWI